MNNDKLYCDGAKKGTVYFIQGDDTEKNFETKKTPFKVTCQPLPEVSDCGVKGRWNRSWTTTRELSSCNGSDSIEGYENESFYFKSRSSGAGWDGNEYDLYRSCAGRETLVEVFSIGCGRPNFATLEFVPDTGEGLKILDADNNLLAKFPVTDCNYKVSCGDDCPDGYIKCETDKYPGYCCIPCEEFTQKINNLSNKIR